jgi:hypothetical protein
MPTATDLVTDLPADFEVFGQAVDTRLKALNPQTTLGDITYASATANTNTRLGIGTSGQVLAVSGGGVPAWTTTADVTPLTTKGDLFTFTTVDARLGVGANGTVLTADSAEATGLKWATPASGTPAIAQIASGTLTSGTQLQLSSLTSYDTLILRVNGFTWATGADALYFRINNSSSSIYDQINGRAYAQANYVSRDSYDALNVIALADQGLQNTNTGTALYVKLTNCKATGFTDVHFMSIGKDSGGFAYWQTGEAIFKSAAAVSSIEFFTNSSRTFTAGNYVLWGA